MTAITEVAGAARHLILIDGSGYIFRAFHAMPPMTNPAGVPVNAVFGFCQILSRFLMDHSGSHIAVVFDTSRATFRQDFYPAYKAHRPEAPVPQWGTRRCSTTSPWAASGWLPRRRSSWRRTSR